MATLALQVPVLGQLDSTEEAKLVSDMTAIQTWANGNIDGSNLAAGMARYTFVSAVTSQSASDGHLYNCVPGITLTLVPAQGATVAVVANSTVFGASPVTIGSGGGVIYGNGTGTFGLASVLLGTPASHLVLYCYDGTNWLVISGQHDTGWVTLSLITNVGSGANFYVPSVRVQGDQASLRGVMVNNTGGTLGTVQWATVPALARPAKIVEALGSEFPLNTAVNVQVNTAGVLLVQGAIVNGEEISLDSINYSLLV